MQLTKLTFTGTTEEYVSIRKLFEEQADEITAEQTTESTNQKSHSTTHEDIQRVLTRLPIPDGQLDLFKALHAAHEGLTQTDLADAIHRTKPQLAGVLGALGRRIAGTPEMNIGPTETPLWRLLDVQWTGSEWLYRMRPALRKALEDEGIV